MICALFLISTIFHTLIGIPISALMPTEVAITYQGEKISAVTIREDAHQTVTALCHGDGNYSYSWQIRVQEDVWADITGQTAQTLELSYALAKSALDAGHGTYIRCCVTDGEETVYSDPVGLTIAYHAVQQSMGEYKAPVLYRTAPVQSFSTGEYVAITVNYLDGISKEQLFSPYTATIELGTDFAGQNVISPTFLGYAPYYNAADPDSDDPNAANDSALTISMNHYAVTSDIVYNVYYKAVDVPYAAKYFFQNIYDDQYTENVRFYKQHHAKTGTIIADAELTDGVNAEGFTKLYHYPESVAADGSTSFECYYDRIYYLLKFDMAGGYGVDPIYARYDTPFAVNTPVRHGYVFAGWDKLDAAGNGDGIAERLPTRIPAENQIYRALWTTEGTTYTAVYWLQNPDDDGYSYWGSEPLEADSASTVSGSDRAAVLGLENNRYTQFERADQNVVVNGDGSTIVNVYYTRKVYTLKFYYARLKNGNYGIVGGSTWAFASEDTTNSNIGAMFERVGADQWGNITAEPALNELGKQRNYVTGNENYINVTYYYLSFTSKYCQDISNLWPLGVFDPIKTSSYFDNGHYAFFSAWNVEHHTYYSWENTNKTLKGNYMRLDYQMLYDYRRYTDNPTVCFLAFWENGADNIVWNEPNQWIYNLYIPPLEGETVDSSLIHNYNNQTYKLYATYDTCDDNNGNDGIRVQTPSAVEGFTFSTSAAVDNPKLPPYNDDIYSRNSYTANFYYRRNNYNLVFYNYDTELTAEAKSVPYDKKLSGYEFTPPYPNNLEENAYEFDGWYTSPGCYNGTEMNWDSDTMPPNHLKLYAKWTPVNHKVRFFKTYTAMQQYENSSDPASTLESLKQQGLYLEERDISHGLYAGSVENPDALVENGTAYDFAGWFYMDNGEKKAYTPLDMPVTEDMDIFADWGSHSPQPYTIHYVLDKTESNSELLALLNTASAGAPQENVRYTVISGGKEYGYVWLSDGYHLCIADDTMGYGYQGSTRTFRPKAGDPYNQLYNEYNTGYFPTLSSHSVTMQYEEDKTNAVHNVFTFTYVYADDITYTVRYLDKNTGRELHSDKVGQTSDAVVTERFQPVVDYIPDAFYKRLVLAVEEDPAHPGEYIGSDENAVIFYYMPNTQSSFYAVHFMLQKPGTDGTNYKTDGSGDYVESDSIIEGIGDTDGTVTITPLTFSGFDLIESHACEKIGTQENVISANGGQFTITIDKSGTELYIFYSRKKFDYKVYYLEYGTDISNLGNLENSDDSVLHPIKTVNGVDYGLSVTETAEIIDGYNCVSAKTQSIAIGHDSSKNNIIFFYAPLQYTVEYHIAGNIGGMLSRTSETIYGDGILNGSQATAHIGYRFDGWYLDESCTQITDTAALFKPAKGELLPLPEINAFYAKFTPQYGSITITRTNAEDESNGDQVFVYRITNQNTGDVINVTVSGNGSVTVSDLLYGNYLVEQCNNWSWRYEDASSSLTLNSENVVAVFNDDPSSGKWLSGNSAVTVNRKGADA